MSTTKSCPECGALVPADAPRGLCPRCLMGAAYSATGSYLPSDNPLSGAAIPAAIGMPEFLGAIRKLGLMPDDELDRLAAVAGDDALGLGRLLVQAKKLTAYQTGAILQGKARGLLIGQYLVQDRLGVGGMGVVFKAEHRPSGRLVALKILPPSFGRDGEAVRRFRREFQVASRLSHPNIVAAVEASEDRGVHYLTMEYIPGYDLDRLVTQGGPMALKLALHCVIQVARGLEAAHAQGVIHRDIKPGNVMIDPAGAVRVLDLGLARVIEATGGFGQTTSGTLTQTGAYMGTVDFIAPEQANDAKSADGRADIYSLACTFYFLLTGTPPFPGDSILKRLMAHQTRPAPSLREARPEVSEALDAIYQKMMAKHPNDRPKSISEVVMALEACRTSAREAGDVSADLKTFARTALKRAPIRGRRGPDASVFARPAPKPDGLSFDPDLNLEDLVSGYRDEAGHGEIAVEKLPPIASWPLPKRVRRRRDSTPYALFGLILFGLAFVAYAFWPRSEVVHPSPAASPETVAIPPAVRPASATLPRAGADGFRSLFNGKDLAGWAGDADDYQVLDGMLSCKPGKRGVIYEPVERSDFVARVEFRLAPGAEGGLLIRYPGQGDGAFEGMCEIQILDDTDLSYENVDARDLHGSAWGMAAARRGQLKPLGEWNVQEVTVRGSTIKVELNGAVILDTDLASIRDFEKGRPHPGKDRRSGYFGVQSGLGANQGTVRFRKIEVRELTGDLTPAPTPAVQSRVLLSDDFSVPHVGWEVTTPEELAKNPDGLTGYGSGTWYCSSRGFANFAWFIPGGPYPEMEAEIAVQVVGDGNTDPRGGALFHFIADVPGQTGDRATRGFQLRMNGLGALMLEPSFFTAKAYPNGPWRGPITHPNLRPAGQPNKLMFRIRKRQLEIFADGVRVGEPIAFDWDLTPASILFGADSWSGTVRADFDRVEIRALADAR